MEQKTSDEQFFVDNMLLVEPEILLSFVNYMGSPIYRCIGWRSLRFQMSTLRV